jgi:hypothetical protein
VKLEVSVEGERFRPGDTVRGTIKVTKGGRSRSLEAFLLYRDATDDYGGTSISVPGGTLHKGALEAGESYEFSIDLPADAKPNFSSAHGRLWWEAHARSDELGPDTHAGQEIEVEPLAPDSA